MNSAPRDRRMKNVRRKIRRVSKKISDVQHFVSTLPQPLQKEVKEALKQAFEIGIDYQELQSMPNSAPMNQDGMVTIGRELKYHIMQTRQIYRDVDQLREIVADLFEEKSAELLKKIIRDNEEISSGTHATDITVRNA